MTRDALGQRHRQSATSILSVVAYQFVATAELPRVSYVTTMDTLFIWTYLCVGATLVTNVRSKRRFRESEQRGIRADRKGRILFPVIYLTGTLLIVALNRVF